jgi:hypothetical protein
MPDDAIRYDILVQEALRGMVRNLLVEVSSKGLPGDHHFFITFETPAEGVRMSNRLREQYPEEMTVVLQHQFRDLKISDTGFEVVLSFGGVPERLGIPFTAIKSFTDPSVQFALQFEALTLPVEQDDSDPKAAAGETPAPAAAQQPSKLSKAKSRTSVPASPSPAAIGAKPDNPEPPDDQPGAKVVRLDRFRKK